MIFSLIVLIIVGVVGYWHYVQGFFSSVLSAILTVFAALIAVGYFETVTDMALGGRAAEYAHGMVLIALFSLSYLLLRVVFDKLVPGNVRMPSTLDKVGAGAMGVVAGLFCAGIFAISAQQLPFDSSIMMFSRYATGATREVTVPTGGQSRNAEIWGELATGRAPITDNDGFADDERQSLWIPADEVVLGLMNRVSDGGTLSNHRPFVEIHPDYLMQLFASRLATQSGARHVAFNLPDKQYVTVPGLFTLDQVLRYDGEPDFMRRSTRAIETGVLKSNPDQILLIVRARIDQMAADGDKIVRMSIAAARLVADRTNYTPVGIVEAGALLRVNRLDDYLFINTGGDAATVDFAFLVPREAVLTNPAPQSSARTATDLEIKPGVFFEFKRMAQVSLAGKQVSGSWSPAPGQALFDRRDLKRPAGIGGLSAPALTPSEGVAPPADAPLSITNLLFQDELPFEVGIPDGAPTGDFEFPSGNGSRQGNRLATLTLNANQALSQMRGNGVSVKELHVPGGNKIAIVVATPPARAGADAWAWASNLGDFEIVDAGNNKFKPHGAFAKVMKATIEHAVGAWNALGPVSSIERTDGRPTDVYLLFVLPQGARPSAITWKGNVLRRVDAGEPQQQTPSNQQRDGVIPGMN
jgi:uncharacterized membrane protein required for colicin V production